MDAKISGQKLKRILTWSQSIEYLPRVFINYTRENNNFYSGEIQQTLTQPNHYS